MPSDFFHRENKETSEKEEYINNRIKELDGKPKEISQFLREEIDKAKAELKALDNEVQQKASKNTDPLFKEIDDTLQNLPPDLNKIIAGYSEDTTKQDKLKQYIRMLEAQAAVFHISGNVRGGGP